MENPIRNPAANGRMKYAIAVPRAKKNRASGIHGRTMRRSLGVSPGATKAHSWYRITGIARMIPTTIEILSLIVNASPRPV